MERLKHNILSLVALVIAVLVLFSTSGISLYSHHCNTSNTSNYSLYIPSESCDHGNEKVESLSCCEPIKETCCSAEDQATKDDDCCTDHAEYIKLETKSVVNYSAPEIMSANLIIIHAYVISQVTLREQIQTGICIQDSPPPNSTSEYLSQIQVYII